MNPNQKRTQPIVVNSLPVIPHPPEYFFSEILPFQVKLCHHWIMDAIVKQRGIVGIGYEGKDLDEFITSLTRSGTRILADVRLNPISRKRGFSKRLLAASLAEAGIGYWHVPELGNPKWNRAGFSGSQAEVLAARERFARMIDGEAAGMRLDEITDAATEGIVAVMCFEADERACHRYVVLNELHRRRTLYWVPA